MHEAAELTAIMERLRAGHDMLPFLTGLYPAGRMQLRPMPAEMQALLEATADYRSPDPGQGPVWLQVASLADAAELIVYRTVDRDLYVVAPEPQVTRPCQQ